jgi:hypothetical protein
VDPRERWQSLQSHLSAARGAIAAGNKTTALEHIEAALLIDPEFLAARMLRDQVTAPAQEMPFTSSVAEAIDVMNASASAAVPSSPVTVSPETLASFEERVMQRVRERESAATVVASAQRTRIAWSVPIAAAAGFLAAMSSTTLHEPLVLHSRSIAMSAPLVALDTPEPLTETVVPDTHEKVVTPEVDRVPVPAAPTAIAMRAVVDTPPEPPRVPPPAPSPAPTPTPTPVTTTAQQPPPVQPAVQPPPPSRGVQMLPPRPMPDVAAASASPTPAPAVVSALLVSSADDRALVDQALQRYRRAYNRLDARSAQSVYPAVNENALARAFGNLESQLISFESCDIDLQGRLANATCHGTSRYVPKIGNHEPRIEPRVWNFTLRKDGAEWTIENARAAR